MITIKTLTVKLDDKLHRLFKIYAISKKEDMSSILVKQIESLVYKQEAEIK